MPRSRAPLRIQKSYDIYEVTTGSAGFVILLKNGKRIMPENAHITFNKRKAKS